MYDHSDRMFICIAVNVIVTANVYLRGLNSEVMMHVFRIGFGDSRIPVLRRAMAARNPSNARDMGGVGRMQTKKRAASRVIREREDCSASLGRRARRRGAQRGTRRHRRNDA
jgi:hypothetical protein